MTEDDMVGMHRLLKGHVFVLILGVDDVQGGHRCVVQGGGCKLDLVVGQLQGRVDPYSPACQLEAPGSDIWVAQPGAEQGGVQHRHT